MSGKTYKKLKPGKHSFQLRASDDFGNVDATAAKRSWKVTKAKKRRKHHKAPSSVGLT